MKKSKKLQIKKIIIKFKAYIKMDKKIIKFDDTEIEEYNFNQLKALSR